MKFITRLRVWIRQWRRKRAAKKQETPLREFVYLDEVSVYSLIASRLGPIAAEFTETQTNSLQSEIGSSIGADTGIAKAELNSRILASQTNGSQVLRKSIVQTTFKELYELEVDKLAVRPISENAIPSEIKSVNDILASTNMLLSDGWLVDPENLSRGQLLEMEVELEAEPIFRISAVVSTLLEIFEENFEVFGLDPYNKLSQVKSIGRILEKLLVGLVPIRGHAIDYEVVELGEMEWIIHRKLLNQIPENERPPKYPLYVVGVAEQSLFWKDIRRILFSKARFRILCRIAQDGLQASWIPVKLANVLDSVMPGLSNQIDNFGVGVLASMDKHRQTGPSVKQNRLLMENALINYAALLAEHYGQTITTQDLIEASLLSDEHCNSFGSQKVRRDAFEAIATFVINRFDLKREPDIVAQYRAVALTDSGLNFLGQPMPFVTLGDAPAVEASEERFLDSEFVAIYW